MASLRSSRALCAILLLTPVSAGAAITGETVLVAPAGQVTWKGDGRRIPRYRAIPARDRVSVGGSSGSGRRDSISERRVRGAG